MSESLANLAKGDDKGKWTLLDTKSGNAQIVDFSTINYTELLILARGTTATNAYAHFSWRISKEEIDLIGANESAWYTQGGYLSNSNYNFANIGIYGDKSIKCNVAYNNGTLVGSLVWKVYYR